MAGSGRKWYDYLVEFLSVFLGILLAFALNRWNEDRKDSRSEEKILSEIRNGLVLDVSDMELNMGAHEVGIDAVNYFRNYINNKPVNQDSVRFYHFYLFRDLVTLQNKSGYESLKSKGLELVTNDSLRFEIISLYDFHYEGLEKIEDGYEEVEFYANYYHSMTERLSEYIMFDSLGQIKEMKTPVSLTRKDYGKLMADLDRIRTNRRYMLNYYQATKTKVDSLIVFIDREVDN